jgi:hypothetical protein
MGYDLVRDALGELVFNVARSRYRLLARVKAGELELEQADRAQWAEVGRQVARLCKRVRYPAPGGSSHTTVRKPNCLGGESLARANRAPGQGGMRPLSRSVGRSCRQQ